MIGDRRSYRIMALRVSDQPLHLFARSLKYDWHSPGWVRHTSIQALLDTMSSHGMVERE
jgi:hypothetical protein